MRLLFFCLLVGLWGCSSSPPDACTGPDCGDEPKGCEGGCAAGQVCSADGCVDRCPGGATNCDGTCVDLQADVEHCGACGDACEAGQLCVEGVCWSDCADAGRVECGGRCVDVRYDRQHCGDCAAPCEEGTLCSEASCEADCRGQRPDVCGDRCVDLLTDPTACGDCGVVCSAGQVCREGECSAACGGRTPDLCGTRCVDTSSDAEHCGDCATRCAVDQVCVDGACADECGEGRPLACGSLCVDPQADARFCGDCAIRCAPGEHCAGGECLDGCPQPDQQVCFGTCVDVRRDAEHCGACGAQCRTGSVCNEGICSKNCSGAFPDPCGSLCTDVDIDPENCGACAEACAAHEVCREGACEPSCGGDTPDVCLGGCVDVQQDVRHCGACGVRCQPGEHCEDGSCEPVCPASTSLCSGTCVDTSSDGAHCGGCGNACDAGQHCHRARCVETVIDIVSGGSVVCASLKNGEHACWGDNQFGAVGPGVTALRHTSTRLTGFSGPILDVATGWAHGCALVDGPERLLVECWGRNHVGQTAGPDDPTSEAFSVPLPEDEVVAGVVTGDNASCAFMESGLAWCWGETVATGHGGTEPAQVPFLEHVESISGGNGHFCARLDESQDHALYCWGNNQNGQVGGFIPSLSAQGIVPDLEPPLGDIDLRHSVSCGNHATCALTGDGEVACWGVDSYTYWGRGETPSQPPYWPELVLNLPARARSVSVGSSHACAVLEDSSLHCWGRHQVGGPEELSFVAEMILPGGAQLGAMHLDTNFVLLEGGNLMSWGNRELEMLNRPLTDKFTPTLCCDAL